MEALFLKLVNLSITATYLALAVILLRLIFKKAPKWISCVLWGLVAVRLIFPFSIESVLSLIPSSEPIPQDFINTATPHIYSGLSVIDNTVNPILSSQLTPAVGDSVNPTQVLTFVLSRVWLIGLCAMLVYAFISWLLLKRKVSTATILKENIRQSEFVDSPFVLGIFKPVIYLPYQINSDDLAYVTAHEQAHIKRRDNWWKPFGFLLLSAYWFNPVMWIVYILLCRDIEAACDERVIRDMQKDELQAYSTALLNCSVHRKRIAACPLAFGEIGVKERIKSVMNYKKPAFWIILVAVIACVVVAVCFLTSPKMNTTAGTPNNTALIATVKEIHSGGQSMVVVGCEDNQEYSVPLVNLEISPAPEVGDTVQIIHTGDILETYPLQFQNVLKIIVLDNVSRPQAVQWFDCLHGEELMWDGRREISLDEFPGVTFRWYSEKLEAITDKEIVTLYTGMPIWSVFFYDLTGDGKPELCSCVSIGSGIIDERIIVYDYANGRSYELSDRMNYDYTLQLNNGQLWVEKRENMQDEVLDTGLLTFQDENIVLAPVIPATLEITNPAVELKFDAEYFRTNGYIEGEQYPKIFWITSVGELDAYITSASSEYDLGGDSLSEGSTNFITHAKKYDRAFFETHDLIFVVLEEPSGSIRHTVTKVRAEMSMLDRVQYFIQPYIERQVPEVGTDDMAEWHIIIEISKEYGAMYSDLHAPIFTQ